MLYMVYVVSIVLYLIRGISWDRITNFMDLITFGFLLFPCMLMLFCTGSFTAFGRAFVFAVSKKEYSKSQCQESVQAVRMVMYTASVFGCICFLISFINSIRSLDWSALDSIGWMLLDGSVAVLSLFYALLVCAVLLPVSFMLKKYLLSEKGNASRGDF